MAWGSSSLRADGLPLEDPIKDRLCDPKAQDCTELFMHKEENILGTLLTLYPSNSQAKTVTLRLVVETSDHVKHNYAREKMPIKVNKPSTGAPIPYCDPKFEMVSAGAVTVLSADASEENVKGEVLVRHEFREAIVKAVGLPLAHPIKDRLCDQKTLGCAEFTVRQFGSVLSTLVDWRPNNVSAKTVSIRLMVETSDHVKHNYSMERMPILVKKMSDGTTFLSGEHQFELPSAGAVTVLSADATEESAKGEILVRHEFR